MKVLCAGITVVCIAAVCEGCGYSRRAESVAVELSADERDAHGETRTVRVTCRTSRDRIGLVPWRIAVWAVGYRPDAAYEEEVGLLSARVQWEARSLSLDDKWSAEGTLLVDASEFLDTAEIEGQVLSGTFKLDQSVIRREIEKPLRAWIQCSGRVRAQLSVEISNESIMCISDARTLRGLSGISPPVLLAEWDVMPVPTVSAQPAMPGPEAPKKNDEGEEAPK